MPNICYLCGINISSEETRDHVPPQQFFAPDIRRQFNVDRLTTLPTHKLCNESFRLDEEYTTRALATTVYDSPTARAVIEHGFTKVDRGQTVGLHQKILRAIDERPSGLYLPGGKVVMRIDGPRVGRVAWKLVRGLYFLETGTVLPADTKHVIEVSEPAGDRTSAFDDLWNAVRGEKSQGHYQAVFAHKYHKAVRTDITLHGWGMLWWDRLIVYCAHLDIGEDLARLAAKSPRATV